MHRWQFVARRGMEIACLRDNVGAPSRRSIPYRGRMIGRRALLSIVAGAATWPLADHAWASAPRIGFLRSTPAAPFAHLATAFRDGLHEAGFDEGRNVTIEYRYADNQPKRLPALAAELVADGVSVIVGNSLAVEAAKAVTATIPIVFVTSDDPVKRGLVQSLGRPGGTLTGVTFFGGGQLGAKRLDLLHELVPGNKPVAFLMDSTWPAAAEELPEVEAAARALGRGLVIHRVATRSEIDAAFHRMSAAGVASVLVSGAPFFTSERRGIVALAASLRLPAIYDVRDFVDAGGLVSYAASFTGAYRQAGVYAGRILQGADPADLPVLQPTQLEMVINLRTARSLGITVPESILLRADEVID